MEHMFSLIKMKSKILKNTYNKFQKSSMAYKAVERMLCTTQSHQPLKILNKLMDSKGCV